MKKTVLLYGTLLAILIIFLRILEYRFFVRELAVEIYVGLVAILFTSLGIWVGLKIINRQQQEAISTDAEIDFEKLKSHGITDRELDVLRLMAGGYSNREIADKLYVSLHTVKTHCSNLYGKLDVKRRTQAIQKAREMSTTV
ncbi:MAG: response regulator transcription factor [bacterium]